MADVAGAPGANAGMKENRKVNQRNHPKGQERILPKRWLVTVGSCLMTTTLSWAGCNTTNQDPTKAHVQFVLESLPALRFFSDSSRTGPPIIQLNERGLYVGDALACEWPNGGFSRTPEPNRVLGFDGRELSQPCPENLPVKSGFGDMGVGTAVLCVEVEKMDNGVAEVHYNNHRLYLDLQDIPNGGWRYEPPRK